MKYWYTRKGSIKSNYAIPRGTPIGMSSMIQHHDEDKNHTLERHLMSFLREPAVPRNEVNVKRIQVKPSCRTDDDRLTRFVSYVAINSHALRTATGHGSIGFEGFPTCPAVPDNSR
ncbi:hypothetical protein PG997_009360 [Apiospora hydei]|uniref:Uncharacterized protein n=1 Tax=Apiospora hydei TaxID=1337664 RepID=A0ABR1VU66_9PEZI